EGQRVRVVEALPRFLGAGPDLVRSRRAAQLEDELVGPVTDLAVALVHARSLRRDGFPRTGDCSAARVMLLCLSSHRRWVLEEPVEVAGEVALEAAVCFAAGFAFLQSPFHVGDCRG